MSHQKNNRTSQYKAGTPIAPTMAPMHITETAYSSHAQCDHCDWTKPNATIGDIKHHVTENPGHQVTAQWAATETFQTP